MQISTILAKKGSTVFTVKPDQTVREAVALLVDKRIGAVVVVEMTGRPVGIISERDIVRELAKKGSTVFTVKPDQSVREAVALLVDKRIGAVVVVNETGRPVGIVSERDIIRELAQNENILNEPVSRVMTIDVIIARPSDDTKAVSKTMTVRRFRHLPVMDHHELVGIVSIGDVVKAQLDEYEGEIETLQTRVEKG